MTSPPFPRIDPVTSMEIDYLALMERARGGPEEPWITYQFGADRKTFWNIFQTDGIYDKPVSVSNGITTHLPDPEVNSTNP